MSERTHGTYRKDLAGSGYCADCHEMGLIEIIRELLSIVEDEGHADSYQPQVMRARGVLDPNTTPPTRPKTQE